MKKKINKFSFGTKTLPVTTHLTYKYMTCKTNFKCKIWINSINKNKIHNLALKAPSVT